MERCFAAHTNIHTSMIAVVPSPEGAIEKVTIPGEAITASGYNPAVVANEFVFVAGNMALARDGTLDPSVYIAPNRQWSGQTSFRRQVHYIVKQRLEPSLKAAGSGLEHSLKAQAYIRGVENFPDFLDAWSQHFRDIPCAVILVPAKDYANSDSMLEINLIALKDGARRRKEVVETVYRPPRRSGRACARASSCFPPA